MTLSSQRPPSLVILAAGRGKRMWAATRHLPKALLPLTKHPPSPSQTFLGRLITQFGKSCRVVVVVGWMSRCVRDFLRTFHPGTARAFNGAFVRTGSLQSLQCAVHAHPWLLDGQGIPDHEPDRQKLTGIFRSSTL